MLGGRAVEESEHHVDELGAGLAENDNKAEKHETEGWRPKNAKGIHDLDPTGRDGE